MVVSLYFGGKSRFKWLQHVSFKEPCSGCCQGEDRQINQALITPHAPSDHWLTLNASAPNSSFLHCMQILGSLQQPYISNGLPKNTADCPAFRTLIEYHSSSPSRDRTTIKSTVTSRISGREKLPPPPQKPPPPTMKKHQPCAAKQLEGE